jgi:spectinomycin phosphotransferase
MIERPPISDETIVSTLREHFSISIAGIEFLPIGNDASAWAYRVDTEPQTTYFLKIRKAMSNQAGLFVPRFLQDHGVGQVLAPLPNKKQDLWIGAQDFFLTLYPFVIGKDAMSVGMPDSKWKEFGSVLKQVHSSELPSDIVQYVRRETFIPKWSSIARELHKQVNAYSFDDPYQREVAAFWKGHDQMIQTIIEQTERIGKYLQQADFEFVLCHADIHTANILLTPDQEMFIVDWDDTLFAPKERDLMFVLGEDTIRTREEQLFFDGYGNVKIDQLALAYYRYEWCVQEIGDFGQRVFLTNELGESTKQAAVEGFRKLFSKGDVIDTAFHTVFETEIRNHS